MKLSLGAELDKGDIGGPPRGDGLSDVLDEYSNPFFLSGITKTGRLDMLLLVRYGRLTDAFRAKLFPLACVPPLEPEPTPRLSRCGGILRKSIDGNFSNGSSRSERGRRDLTGAGKVELFTTAC